MTKKTPPTLISRTRRSAQLAAGLIAGLSLVTSPAMAAPPQEKAPAAEQDKAETPEQEVSRLEKEVTTLESDLKKAETCVAEAKGKEAAAGCPSTSDASGALERRRTALRSSRARESSKKKSKPRSL